MILNDRELRALIRTKEFALDPFEDALVQPSSVDLRLDDFARVIQPGAEAFDVRDDPEAFYETLRIPPEGHVLAAHATFIGQTAEFMRIPETCQGQIAQRSSVIRLGIHVSSSLVNPGYAGKLPIIVSNLSSRPIRLLPGLPICQLVLMTLSGRPDVIYPEKADAKYHDERELLASRIAEDARRWVRPASPRLADLSEAEKFRKVVSIRDDRDD
jgi:dCTP deaminase